MFTLYEDPEDAERVWQEALASARDLMPKLLPFLLPPDVPEDPIEAYLTAMIFCAKMAEVTAGLNGFTLDFPSLVGVAEAHAAARRLISWETCLPWPSDRPVSEREALALAYRFEALAQLCRAVAARLDRPLP